LLISNINEDQVLIAKHIDGDNTNASSIIADQKDARGAIRQEAYHARLIVGYYELQVGADDTRLLVG
jgi:hypothetical protein